MFSAAETMPRAVRSHCNMNWSVPEPEGMPPLIPTTAGGLSGRPRCRIFPVGRLWVLQVETGSGWLHGAWPDEPPMRLKFPSLGEAVAYAEQHGYDYRIITPSPVVRITGRDRRIHTKHRGEPPARGRPLPNGAVDMERNLSGKKILIVEGSLLAGQDLEQAFIRAGAQVYLTANIISAFGLLRSVHFEGAVIDQGLHNEAFDICCELRELGIPEVCCAAPHRLQASAARQRDAEHVVRRLDERIAHLDLRPAEYVKGGNVAAESCSSISS